MKAAPVTGLVGAGGVNRLFLARMPKVLGALGPIKAASFRVARRIANTFRAGYAVSDYGALEPCKLIWIAVPESMLDRVIRDLAAQTPLEGTIVVLCESARDSRFPLAFTAKGARVATLNVVPEFEERTFVAEGDPQAVSELYRIAASEKRKLIELQPAAKALYFSGVHLATHLLLPWVAGAVESFREAGLTRAQATQVTQTLGMQILRAYGKAGRKAWDRRAVEALRRNIADELDTLRVNNPRVATIYGKGIDLALAYFADV